MSRILVNGYIGTIGELASKSYDDCVAECREVVNNIIGYADGSDKPGDCSEWEIIEVMEELLMYGTLIENDNFIGMDDIYGPSMKVFAEDHLRGQYNEFSNPKEIPSVWWKYQWYKELVAVQSEYMSSHNLDIEDIDGLIVAHWMDYVADWMDYVADGIPFHHGKHSIEMIQYVVDLMLKQMTTD